MSFFVIAKNDMEHSGFGRENPLPARCLNFVKRY